MSSPNAQPDLFPKREIFTVSQLASRIKATLEADFGGVWVKGEISNFLHARSGHMYFTLKDASSQLRLAMFKSATRSLTFEPDNGLEVLCYGKISFYEARGDAQMIVQEMAPAGQGAMQLAFERLKEKLRLEGLFDPQRKQPLPFLPRKVGVVTSDRGAAIHDIVTVLTRRFPNIEILLYPSRVQGPEAPTEIIRGIEALDARADIDVLIIGRGGGSLEDLWAFNDEALARCIATCRKPVVSAVGHEVDFSISDFVADVRAATPSQAAELVVPMKRDLVTTLETHRRRMSNVLGHRLDRVRRTVAVTEQRRVFLRQQERIERLGQRLDDVQTSLHRAAPTVMQQRLEKLANLRRLLRYHAPAAKLERQQRALEQLGRRLEQVRSRLLPQRQADTMQIGQRLRRIKLEKRLQEAAKDVDRQLAQLLLAHRQLIAGKREQLHVTGEVLKTLNPEAMLKRGYSIVTRMKGKKVISQASQLKAGEAFKVRMHRGTVHGRVEGMQNELDFDES